MSEQPEPERALPAGAGVTAAAPAGVAASTVRSLAADNHAHHNIAYAEALGGRVLRTPDLVAVDISSPLVFLNCAVLLRDLPADGVADVTGSFYGADAHVVVDYTDTVDLAPYGYAATDELPVMVRQPSPVSAAATGISVERVCDEARLAEFERVVVAGMGLTPYAESPPFSLWGRALLTQDAMRLYLGRLAGRPVTCAADVVTAGSVGVYAVATLPTHRRQGHGAAVTAAALADAPPLPAVLTSSPLGFGVYRRLGFIVVASRRTWRKDATSAAVT